MSRSASTPTNGAITWSEGLEMGYRWYLANHVAPLFPIGYSESYTRFSYSDLRVDRKGHDGRIDARSASTTTDRSPGPTFPRSTSPSPPPPASRPSG